MPSQRVKVGASIALTGLLVLAAAGPARAQQMPKIPLGLYIGGPNVDDQGQTDAFNADYAQFVSAMNALPAYYESNVDFTMPVLQWGNNAGFDAASRQASTAALQMIPLIGLPMYSTDSNAGTPDSQFQAFAAGTYDSIINNIVQNWSQTGGITNQVYRLGWEMNLNGTPYYVGSDAQSQAHWVTAFQHIHDVLEQAGVQYGVKITVIWNPGVTNYTPAHATADLYPGDQYVDMIGIDMYADMYPFPDYPETSTFWDWRFHIDDQSLGQFVSDPVNRKHYWTYPAAEQWGLDQSEGNSEYFSLIADFSVKHHKPLAICETGAGNVSGGRDVNDDPTFVDWLSEQLNKVVKKGGSIGLVNIWDSYADGNYEFTYPSDYKPKELAAWRAKFGN